MFLLYYFTLPPKLIVVIIQLVFIINSERVSIRSHYHKIIEGRIQLGRTTMESRGKTFLQRRALPRCLMIETRKKKLKDLARRNTFYTLGK